MATVTLKNLLESVATTLATIDVTEVQTPHTLREGINDDAIVQVWWNSLQMAVNSGTDRNTFGGSSGKPVRWKNPTMNIDVYARQRSQIAEDQGAVIDLADLVVSKLEEQSHPPYFDNASIKAWSVTAEHVTFKYGDPEISYAGLRFVLTLEIY